MRTLAFVVAGLLMLGGLVFFLQGMNVLPGSFMTGQAFWAFVGFLMLVVGAALALASYRVGRRA